jgi:RNA polymerase sigma factor (sigma-70 family)
MAAKRVVDAVRVAVRRLQDSGAADADLLAHYARDRNDGAFAELVRRHGAMVKGIARRVLPHEEDAEDVCQAVFLLLARKAARLKRGSVAGWLCSAARLTALNARKTRTRRATKEAAARPSRTTGPTPLDQLTATELVSALDEELARLPDRYRGPLVLCYLEGLSRDEAARRLGVPTSTLNVQLERGRNRLQALLGKRGIGLGLALLAVAAVPVAGVAQQRIVQLLLHAQAGGVVPPAVASLMPGSTIMTKVKFLLGAALIAGVITAVGVAGLGEPAGTAVASASSQQPVAEKQPQQGPQPPPGIGAEKEAAPSAPEAVKPITLQGRVLGPDGRPVPGAKLLLTGQAVKPADLGVSGTDGRFTVTVPGNQASLYLGPYLVSCAEGAGVDFLSLAVCKPGETVELRLVKDNVIRGRIVNTEAKPIRGVRVSADEINVHVDNTVDTFLAAFLRILAGGRGTAVVKTLWAEGKSPFAVTTDAEGRFSLSGLGAERTVRLRLSGGGIADTTVEVVNRAGFDPEPYNKAFRDYFIKVNGRRDQPWMASHLLSGPNVSVVATPGKVLRGTVTDADTGQGLPGLTVQLAGDSTGARQPFILQAKTDARGRYAISGAPPAQSYQLQVPADPATGYLPSQVSADGTPGSEPVPADLKVKKGVIVTGQVIDQATGKPVPSWAIAAVLKGNPFAKAYQGLTTPVPAPYVARGETGADGTFRLVSVPGPVLLMVGLGRQGQGPEPLEALKFKAAVPDPRHPEYFPAVNKFGLQYHGLDGYGGGVEGNACKVLELKAGAPLVKQDLVLERTSAATVQIGDADGQPLRGVWVAGLSPRSADRAFRMEPASCPVYDLEPGKTQLLAFCQPDRKLVATLTLQGDEKGPLGVKLGPAGAVKGRLLDEAGKPLAGIEVAVHYHDEEAAGIEWAVHADKPPVSDGTGAFRLEELIPGLKFDLLFRQRGQRLTPANKADQTVLQVKAGACLDVGASKLKVVPVKSPFAKDQTEN